MARADHAGTSEWLARNSLRVVMAGAIMVQAGCTSASRTVSQELAGQARKAPVTHPSPPPSAPARLTPVPPRPPSALTRPTSAPAVAEEGWERVLQGPGFVVWCDAAGNARLVTDRWPWHQFPMPDNPLRQHFLLARAAARVAHAGEARPPNYLDALLQKDGENLFAALALTDELPGVLAQALRDTPPGARRGAAVAIAKSLLAPDVRLGSGGLLPVPYQMKPSHRRLLAAAVEATPGPATQPAQFEPTSSPPQ